jgi:hypothetical protein
MNAYNSNRRQSQPRDAHNVERRAPDNPQAVPPQSRTAAGGSNASNCSSRPTRGTTFQEPADAAYGSYLCHPVYVDRSESFFSGQELEPTMDQPVVAKFPEAESTSLSIPSEIEIEDIVADRQQEVDLVPHVLATGLITFQSTTSQPINAKWSAKNLLAS